MITDTNYLEKIEKSIVKKIRDGMPYLKIQQLVLDKLDISISTGQISNLKKRYIRQ